MQRQLRDSLTSFLSDVVPYPVPPAVIEASLANPQPPDGDEVTLAIASPADHLVGWVQVMRASRRHGSVRLGVGISDPTQRRQGYASDAICVLLRHLFDERRYHRAQADVFSYNEASQRLFLKLGFTPEGRLRESHFAGGRYWDTVVFGITASEFAAAHPEYRIAWLPLSSRERERPEAPPS